MSNKDRWHQLADAVAASNMRASDKSVFRFLLDKADWATAELPPGFTPDQVKIARQTSHSLRQVKYATGHLRRHGWIRTEGTTAPGRTLGYSLGLGAECDCTGRVHVRRDKAATGATDDGQRVQPDAATGATFGPRSGATNGCNAAGQTGRQTRGTERVAKGRRSAKSRPAQNADQERRSGCPLCHQDHEGCRFGAGSLFCVQDGCGNPHHRAPVPP